MKKSKIDTRVYEKPITSDHNRWRSTGAAVLAATMLFAAGCGQAAGAANLEGSCGDILATVYENADLDAELREAMQYYETITIDESWEMQFLGTEEADYTDAVCSLPAINVIPYQCVLLRVEDADEVEETKQLLAANADPRKWICVEAESVVIENVGDVILFVMADTETADAIKAAFLALDAS